MGLVDNKWEGLMKSFLTKQGKRLKVPSIGKFRGYLMKFANFVIEIESSGNVMAMPKTSSAKGLFQFTDASVHTAKQRMVNMGFDVEDVREVDLNPQKWSIEMAYCVFFANMFAQRGSDRLLKLIGEGKGIGPMKDAYYKFHHTAPDEATEARVNKIMV